MKALVVDDEATSSRIVSQLLSPHVDSVDVAGDAQRAFDLCAEALESKAPYDVICLDIKMPGVDGIEFLRELRALEEERGRVGEEGAKVLVISGACDMSTYTDAESAGCTAYLCKPVSREKLLEQLKFLNICTDPDPS